MSPELLERVALALQACWRDDDENGWRNMARYALALAERAAREAFKDGWFSARGSVPGLGLSVRPADTEAAVARAVEGA